MNRPRPAPSVKQTQPKQPQQTNQQQTQEPPQPNWLERFISDTFTKTGVILPPILNFPQTVAYPNGDIKVSYRVLDGFLYRLYSISLLMCYACAICLAVAIGGEDGWLAFPILGYIALDLLYMPRANRGFKIWWLGKSFQQYWQAKCLQWFSRQVTVTFDTQQVIITHKLFGIVYHHDRLKREAIERAITGGFVGFYLSPPHPADVQLAQELAQNPVLQRWWEWGLPMPVNQGEFHLKLFVADQPLDILHAPQPYADLLHRRLQSILTGQLTAHDITELNRRKHHA
jgi:hypothetical protein